MGFKELSSIHVWPKHTVTTMARSLDCTLVQSFLKIAVSPVLKGDDDKEANLRASLVAPRATVLLLAVPPLSPPYQG